MSASKREATVWVKKSAEYILQKEAEDDRLYNADLGDAISRRLDRISSVLEKAETEALNLERRLRGERDSYIPALAEIIGLRSKIADARAHQITTADKFRREMADAPRGHKLHKRALNLADAYCGISAPRKVRRLAEEILHKAGIPEDQWASDRAVSGWLNKLRDESSRLGLTGD